MDFACKRVHFIGIAGVSMGALAELVRLEGAIVTGSDSGVPPGHRANNIQPDIDLVVINGAIADDNTELVRARELSLTIIDRAKLLAEIEKQYVNRIAVAGTHGKSTTTAMIGCVLRAGGLNPTVHSGAGDGLQVGGFEYFVTEACEFKRSFLELVPTVAVVTNIDADHMNCYRDFEDLADCFARFTQKAQTVFYGDSVADIKAAEHAPAKYGFTINGTDIKLGIVGKHNVSNAVLAVKVGQHFGVSMEVIKSALENFSGVPRRFEYIGKTGNCDLIIDYAHHPTEIETTIETAKSLYGKDRFLIVFQPHTYTRTVALFDEFVATLRKADCLLYKTFSAREKPIKGGSAHDLARALGVKYFARKESLQRYLAHKSIKYDAVILTGAGDVDKLFKP